MLHRGLGLYMHKPARGIALCPARACPVVPRIAVKRSRSFQPHSAPAYGGTTPHRTVGGNPEPDAAIVKLTDQLRLLETERDDAVKTAESCARTAVKLEEMARLLERLALDRITEGDEDGARQVLKEKMAVKEVWTRTSERAQANYALAAKLADKIGQRQAELMPMLSPGAGSGTASQQADNSNKLHQASQQQTVSTPISNNRGYSSSQARNINVDWSATGSGSKSASSAGSSKSSSTGNFYQFPWEKSIFEAQERVKQAERDAAVAGTRVAWQTRETLDEARDRLRSQAVESISSARSRIQRKAHESIEEAQARIAAEDAAVLQQVHQLVARYRAGGYVPEDEVEWAFRQLEKRAWRAM